MDDRALAEFIDRIIRDSRIHNTRARHELRRELESHFAEFGSAPEAMRDAVARFGSPTDVSDGLGGAHRRGRLLAKAFRIFVALAASSIVALAIQLVASLQIDARGNLAGLGQGFSRAVAFSAMIVVALIVAWELDIDSLCARLERHPVRLVATLLALAAIMIGFHAAENTLVAPSRALVASAVDVVIWTCTIAILARTDRTFARVFRPLER
jgi:hypothetical protein